MGGAAQRHPPQHPLGTRLCSDARGPPRIALPKDGTLEPCPATTPGPSWRFSPAVLAPGLKGRCHPGDTGRCVCCTSSNQTERVCTNLAFHLTPPPQSIGNFGVHPSRQLSADLNLYSYINTRTLACLFIKTTEPNSQYIIKSRMTKLPNPLCFAEKANTLPIISCKTLSVLRYILTFKRLICKNLVS